MSKHPAKVFGYPIEVSTSETKEMRAKHWCPFMDKACEKKSRLITYPMGVCSLKYRKDALVQALQKRIAKQTPALQLHF